MSLETIPDSDTGLMKFVASDEKTMAKRNKLKEEERRVNEYRLQQAREKALEEKRRKNEYDLQQQQLWKAQVNKIFDCLKLILFKGGANANKRRVD